MPDARQSNRPASNPRPYGSADFQSPAAQAAAAQAFIGADSDYHPAVPDNDGIFDYQNGYAVVQVSPDPRPMQVTVDALMRIGMLAVDANQHAHLHGRGVVASKLNEVAARQLVEVLRAQAIECVMLPVEQAQQAPSLGRVTRLTYETAGLHARVDPVHPREVLMPWDAISLVLVGHVFMEHKEVHYEQKPLSLSYADRSGEPADAPDRIETRTSEDHLTAAVLGSDGVLILDAKTLTYGHLAPHIGPTSIENFKLTIGDILQRAPRAEHNEGVDLLLAGRFKEIEMFRRASFFEEEIMARWIAQRWRAGELR